MEISNAFSEYLLKMTTQTNQEIKCPISEHKMTWVMTMPIDCKTGKLTPYKEIYKCEESNYAMVVPRPEASAISSFYDLEHYYTQGESQLSKDEEQKSILDKIRMKIALRFDQGIVQGKEFTAEWVSQLLPDKTTTICELGCGGGKLLLDLKTKGYPVCGVEQDRKALVFSKGLEVYQGTAEEIPVEIEKRTFDVVLMSHVLEHCLDPLKVMNNVYNLVKPGGYFICEVPNNEALAFQWSGVTWEMLEVPRHLNFFTSSSLRAICEKQGFRVENIDFLSYFWQLTNERIAIEAKIYDRIVEMGVQPKPFPVKNSKSRAWKLLLSTLFAPPAKKYESIRVICRKP